MKQKTCKKQELALDRYFSPKNSIESCQKYMKLEEYWHEIIKNYRYDGDVSATASRPRGAFVLTLTSLCLILAGAYPSRLDALPLLMSCGKSVDRPSAHSSRRYLRSMMGDSTRQIS